MIVTTLELKVEAHNDLISLLPNGILFSLSFFQEKLCSVFRTVFLWVHRGTCMNWIVYAYRMLCACSEALELQWWYESNRRKAETFVFCFFDLPLWLQLSRTIVSSLFLVIIDLQFGHERFCFCILPSVPFCYGCRKVCDVSVLCLWWMLNLCQDLNHWACKSH